MFWQNGANGTAEWSSSLITAARRRVCSLPFSLTPSYPVLGTSPLCSSAVTLDPSLSWFSLLAQQELICILAELVFCQWLGWDRFVNSLLRTRACVSWGREKGLSSGPSCCVVRVQVGWWNCTGMQYAIEM